ncbi:MAG: DUF488 domain-containing protein [Chthoniobacterales bacterium]
MAIRIVQLGSPRAENEGLRLGTVRRPPRGVRKEDYARLHYFDVWLPELAPSAPVVSWALAEPFTPARWAKYENTYRREMSQPSPKRLLQLLAALSKGTDFSVGCYCEEETRCHRSIVKELLVEQGATLA